MTSGHDVADARIHRIATALQRQGARVELLGLGSPANAPADVQVWTWRRPGVLGRLKLANTVAQRAHGGVLLAIDPDSLIAARVWGTLRNRPVVADVHEDYTSLVRDRQWARGPAAVAARILVGLANRAAAGAALTLVADDHVPPRRARTRLVVRNLADPHLVGSRGSRDPSPRAVYIGDVRASRGVFDMLTAIAGAPGWTLDVIGPIAAADQAAIDMRLGDADLRNRVRFHGRLAPIASWQMARGAWVGFALLHDTPAFHDAVPSKVYEYLHAGIIPIVSDLPRQRRVAVDGGGVVVDGPQSAAEAMSRITADPSAFFDALRADMPPYADGEASYDEAAAKIVAVAHG
ncbi:MAG: glycosyltransferase [Nostocoides sp.]